jgi:hypothetical protein
MESNADPLRQTPPEDHIRITLEEAVRDFLADEEARQLPRRRGVRTLVQKLLP